MTRFAWMLSMGVGFLSLSQEILWVRMISFATHGMAQSFALVLVLFLLGIALGSAFGKRLCERGVDLLRAGAIVLGTAAVLDLSLAWLLRTWMHNQWADVLLVMLLVVLTAGLKSIMFPIAHHLGSQQSGARIGRSVSKVYFGNIVGSTLGPIVTGYILLDRLTLDGCLLLVGLGTGLLSVLCAAQARTPRTSLGVLATVLAVAVVAWPGDRRLAAAIASHTPPGAHINHMVENRHGIIHTLTIEGEPDTVMGGNIYDGMVSVDMASNPNGLDRALVLLATHPDPARVLVIGLSTGAWARVLSASPRIRELAVVEINPGYLQLIARYPQVSGLLTDPRVHIAVDDGRRWMRRNPDEKFDLIVQNTTFHWRAYATNILSREYMELTRRHLKPGGIVAINTTWSSDVVETAAHVFPFVERRHNFVYGSDRNFAGATAGAESAYRELRLDGAPVFAEAAFGPGGLARAMVDRPFADQRLDDRFTEAPTVITDQSLLPEYAHGFFRASFPSVYRRIDAVRVALHR